MLPRLTNLFELTFIVLFVIRSVSTSQIGTINDLPSLNDGDQIAIYLLESSFPYNAPKEARYKESLNLEYIHIYFKILQQIIMSTLFSFVLENSQALTLMNTELSMLV